MKNKSVLPQKENTVETFWLMHLACKTNCVVYLIICAHFHILYTTVLGYDSVLKILLCFKGTHVNDVEFLF
jgi:hypothetical protein